MGVSLEQYRARIGGYQQPAQHEKPKEKERMVQLKKVDHDLAWKYTQVALVVLYISLCYWVLILSFKCGMNQSSPFPTPGYTEEGVKSIPKQCHVVTANQLDPFSMFETFLSSIHNSSADWSDDNPWRHATATRTCNLLCSGDIEENPGPTIGRRDQMVILRHLLTELLSDAARQSAYQRLVRHVRQSGLKFRPDEKVPKDGNCMFHAISDQLLYIDGHVITHVQLRQGIVNYLRSNPSNDCGDHMRMYVADQDWDAYLASMSREGTWGDHIVLQAIANMLGRDIRIISSVESDNYEIVLSPRSTHLTRPPLLLGHLAENHYYSLAERTVLGLKRSTSMDSLVTNIPSKKRKIMSNTRLSCLDLDEGALHFSNAPLLDLTDEFRKKSVESIRSKQIKLLQTQLSETKQQKQELEAKLEVNRHETDIRYAIVKSLQREVTRLREKEETTQKIFGENKSEIQQLKDVNESLANQIRDLLQEKEKLASKLAMQERLEESGVKIESKKEATQTSDSTNADAAEIQQLMMEKEQLGLYIKRCEETIEALQKELELIKRDHGHQPAVNREEVEESQNGPDTQPKVLWTELVQKGGEPGKAKTQSEDDNETKSESEDDNETMSQSEDDNERNGHHHTVKGKPGKAKTQSEDDNETKSESKDDNETMSQSEDDNERNGHRHTVKLVFLGKTMAGKTSLKQTLQSQSSKLVSEDEPRTLSCEIDDWKTRDTHFKIYDFGGSKDYTLAHQLFLSPQGMHLLVIDLSKYNKDAFSDHIGDWLESLYAHVPFEHFCLVGSHADEISETECRKKESDIKEDVLKLMQGRIEQMDSQMMEIERLLKIVQTDPTRCLWSKKHLEEELDKCRSLKSIAEDHMSNLTMHTVSSKTPLQGIKNLTDYLIEYASKVENQCEVEEIPPQIINQFNNCLTEGNIDTCPCWITDDKSRTLAHQHGLDDDEQYLKVLKYLHCTGSILCYNMGQGDSQMIVFYNPAGMIDFVNVLFSGPADECRLWHCLPAEITNIKRLLKRKSSLKLQDMEALMKTIYSSGPEQNLIKSLLDDVCDQYGVCFPVPKHSDTPHTTGEVTYWFPYHLSEKQPEYVTNKIQQFDTLGAEQIEVLFQMKFAIGRRQFFERYCAYLNQLENVARTWKGGAFLWTKGNYMMPIVILQNSKLSHGEKITNFSIKAWGITQREGKIEVLDTNTSRLAMWKVLSIQIHHLEYMLYHGPGVKYGIFVVCQCSDCKTKTLEGSEEDEPHYFRFHWDIDCLEEYRDGIITCPESHEVMPHNLVVPPTAVSNDYRARGKAKEVSCKIASVKVEKLRSLLSEKLGKEDKSGAYRRLASHVRQSGLKFRQDVPKDGNCMFHTISDQLQHTDGTRITHSRLRQQVVDYLKENPYNEHGDHLQEYMYVPNQDWDAYLASMSREGTWGDHIVLQAMATMLGRDIRIISSVESDNYETVLPPISGSASGGPPLLLGHYAENHYASLQVDDISTASSVVADGPSLLSTGPEQTTILLINDEYSTSMDDINTINRQLAQLFIKAGAIVYIVVLRASSTNESCAKSDGVSELLTPVLFDGDTRPPVLEWLKFDHEKRYPKLSELHVDYIIGHSYTTSLAAINIKEKQCHTAKPVLFNHTILEDIHHHEGPFDENKERNFLQQAEKAHAVFSVGQRVYKNFEPKLQKLGDKKPKHMCFLPRPSKCFADLKVNFADGQKRVLFFGKVTKEENWKGHDIVVWAMDTVAAKTKDNVNLTIRGITEDEWENSKEILGKNLLSGALNPTLLPYGTQEEVCESIQQAHLVLMPSRAEPFGLVGLEAIAAGIPVLISDKSGLADMIKDLIKEEKCHPDMRHYIINTSMNESNQKGWASSIEDRLGYSKSEFDNAANFKKSLLESKYWKESHQNLLQVCGLNIDLWNCLDHLCNTQQSSSQN